MNRPKTTTIRRKGRNSLSISFSKKDGKTLAKRIRDGQGLMPAVIDTLDEPEEEGS